MTSSFKETSHLSEIIENSKNKPVIIFKFSSECGSSERLKNKLEKLIDEKKLTSLIYLVIVQNMKALSKNIEGYFGIKHESPQIIVLSDGKPTYSESHDKIEVENFVIK
ncbi:MAG TPA: bacillithiol system redox-active protein YtxJ [Candidatus Paceibacterota bacterium]